MSLPVACLSSAPWNESRQVGSWPAQNAHHDDDGIVAILICSFKVSVMGPALVYAVCVLILILSYFYLAWRNAASFSSGAAASNRLACS